MKQKLTKIFVIMLIVTTLLSLVSIFSTANALNSTPQNSPEPNPTNKTFTGVVRYKNLESGFYYIGKYILKGAVDFKPYVGKRVVMSGYLEKSDVSIYMWGKGTFNVITIKENKKYQQY